MPSLVRRSADHTGIRMISGPPSGKNVERGRSIRPVRKSVSSITRAGAPHCGIRIDGAVRDTSDRGVETRFTNAARELAQQRLLQKRFDLASRGRALATLVLARLARPGPVPVDRLDELRQTVP